ELTKSQVADFKEVFSKLDKDNDGCITATELGMVINSIGYDFSKSQLQSMVDNVDSDKDGKINFDEFLKMMTIKMSESDNDRALREAFKVYDKDGNGFITAAELKSAMESIGEKISYKEVEEMISHADLDGDGRINYEEFIRMMNS
ncbi:16472_t:CDS:2, partial [Cetraspora pellucida]